MSKVIERISDHLFPLEGKTVVNVKFFPGHNRAVTADDLADQLARADAQIDGGAVTRTTMLDASLTVATL